MCGPSFGPSWKTGLLRAGPPYQLAAWKFDATSSPPVLIDLTAARRTVKLFRDAMDTPLGGKLWAVFTWSAFHHALWQFTPWGFERAAHLVVRSIRSVMAENPSLQSAEAFAGSLRSGALAYLDSLKLPAEGEETPFGARRFAAGDMDGKMSGHELETVFGEMAAKVDGCLSTKRFEDLADYLARPDTNRPWPPIATALFLPNKEP